jgi:hypothetical protein
LLRPVAKTVTFEEGLWACEVEVPEANNRAKVVNAISKRMGFTVSLLG